MSDTNAATSWLLPALSVLIAYQHLQLSRDRLAFEKAQQKNQDIKEIV